VKIEREIVKKKKETIKKKSSNCDKNMEPEKR
jgi:hypothetical protein